MPFRVSVEQELLDLRTEKLNGGTMRLWDVLAVSESAQPSGVLIAQFVLPNPSHNACTYDSTNKEVVATMRGTWADQSADAAGTFRGYTVTNPSGQIIDYGSVGIAGSGAIVIVNGAAIAQGANFSITEYTLVHKVMA